MYEKIIEDLVVEVRNQKNHQDFLLRDLFYVAKKFTISSVFRTLIPSKTEGIYAFVEENIQTTGKLDYIIRYLGRSKDIRIRLLKHEKDINARIDDILAGKEIKGKNRKYLEFAKKLLENPKSYAIYIWRWKHPRPIHENIFNGKEIGIIDAEGIIGGILGEVYGNQCYNSEFISTSIWALKEPNENFMNRSQKIEKNKTISSDIILKKWMRWCDKYITKREIPLFDFDEINNQLNTTKRKNGDIILIRNSKMEMILEDEILKIYNSYTNKKQDYGYDGLIYLMYTYPKYLNEFNLKVNNEKEIIPIYFGKTETIGVNGKYSENIKGVHNGSNKSKYARWGDNSAYHIGDLSDVLYENEKSENSNKYLKWAEFLFKKRVMRGKDKVILKFPIFFWAKAWHKDDEGLILNLPCSTCFLERQLIAISNILFPEIILNEN